MNRPVVKASVILAVLLALSGTNMGTSKMKGNALVVITLLAAYLVIATTTMTLAPLNVMATTQHEGEDDNGGDDNGDGDNNITFCLYSYTAVVGSI
ncbi:MAG: hypothetical protein WBL44_13280 [Nitrososphaeraceae archaeon]|jgi:hypothetical protein